MSAPADDPVAELDALLTQLTGQLPDTTGADPEQHGGDQQPAELFYRDVREFVQEYLIHVVERRISVGGGAGIYWCSQWWAHPEALSRVYALWRAWESLRVTDPATGMASWWRDHLDPHLNQLGHPEGPFSRCQPALSGKEAKHYQPEPLPVEPMPDEVLSQFPEART